MTDRPSSMRRGIVLIGLRGSGKTTVGRELARLLSCDHADTDERIAVQTGRSIADIFHEHGEEHFRCLEKQLVTELMKKTPRILSVGGGTVLDPDNVAVLRRAAQLVWLTAPPSVLWDRIRSDPRSAADRPPLTRCGGRAGLAQLLIQREPIYRAAADLIVDTLNKTPHDVAREIIEQFKL